MSEELEKWKNLVGNYSPDGEGNGKDSLDTDCTANSNSDEKLEQTHYQRTNSSNLVQDEFLMQEVRKYPCLYDRCHENYKKTEKTFEAWEQVCRTCDWINNPEEAARLFEVLKKRYSKKKMDCKRAHMSPDAESVIKKTRAELKKYNFMNWMEPFIRFRTVKLTNETGEDRSPDHHQPIAVANNKTQISEQMVEESREKYDEISYNYSKEANRKRPYDECFYPNAPNRPAIISVHSKSPKTSTCNGYTDLSSQDKRVSSSNSTGLQHQHQNNISYDEQKRKPSPIEPSVQVVYSLRNKDDLNYPTMASLDEESRSNGAISNEPPSRTTNVAHTSSTVYHTKQLSNDDELFSAMVFSELSKLDVRKKCVVKHNISNILFEAMIEHYDDSANWRKEF